MGRRGVLGGLVGCTACAAALASLASRAQATGFNSIGGQGRLAPGIPAHCALAAGFNPTSLRMMAESGNPRLDRAMIAELRKVLDAFDINPGIKYIDDSRSPNAFATTETIVQGTTGTMLFGLSLIQTEMNTEYGGAAVAGIAAHEGAHIFQFFSSYGRRLTQGRTAREMELHADLLAGWYFGHTGRTERSLVVFGRSLFSKGDYDYNDPRHHGTPDERLAAMRTGFAYNSRGYSLGRAADAGVDYVT
ncbi:MAG: hypothetical protein AAF677_08185 [Pseudomonadota bacterium]